MFDDVQLIAGTYARLGGTGLVSLVLGGDDMRVGAPVGNVSDASFGLWSTHWQRFFFVVEQDEGQVAAWEESSGDTTETAATKGSAPCHLALDPDERLLAVANYENGSVALFRIDLQVSPPLRTANRQLVGHGLDPDRQAGPHAHWVGFGGGGNWLYVVDLGADR
ncbi:MAG TPA: beta-propeller fold lactonase family protein, partial [Sphingomicrobium sp.]